MSKDYLSIASEIQELEKLLASIPESNLIERLSLESRLKSAKAQLAATSQQIAPKAWLTFRGRPVFGSHGIAADFGAKATSAFSEAFAAVAAALNDNLRYMGRIPDRDKNQLLITGTAIGSFGFEFELPAPEPSLFSEADKTPQEAMTKIEALFRLAAEGTDDEVTEIVEEVHPRAVKKVYEFLDLMVQHQAWCGLQFAERFFRYTDYEQVKMASERLKSDNIQEWEETYRGMFQGVLPAERTFEFRPADQAVIIKGKVGADIDDPGVLNRDWLLKPVQLKLRVMQVGQGRPRYTLMTLADIRS